MSRRANVTDLLGRTLASVTRGDNVLTFVAVDGAEWDMCHDQECCEDVYIDDIAGDLSDLVASPILMAEEATGDGVEHDPREPNETWTFYRFATAKGYVTIRWYGTSNGYYGEGVDFKRKGP